jgi:signal transduction histidine kinase
MSVPTEESPHVRRVARPDSSWQPSARGAFDRQGDILDSLPDAVWVLDASTLCVTYANRSLSSLLGYFADELVGSPLGKIAPELTDLLFRRLTSDLGEDAGHSVLHRTCLRDVDDVNVPVEVRTHALLAGVDMCEPRAYVNVAREVRTPAESGTWLRRAEVDDAIRDDRDRIARDLHDSVIQRIFASAMSVHALRATVTGADMDAGVAHIVDELDRSIVEIRSLIYRISPDEPAVGGFRTEMITVLEEEHSALGLSPTVRFTGDLDDITGEWRHHILAIFRELLSNIARHADASRVDIEVEVGQTIVMRVGDDGIGFDPAHLRCGRGVRNVTQRADALGGSLLIRSRPGGGTLVECVLPLPS